MRQHRSLNHSRPSRLRNADDDDTNNRNGYWSREQLERMNDKFVAAMEQALRADQGNRAA